MYEIDIENLDLEQIAISGQCFRFRPLGEKHYLIPAFDRCLEIKQEGNHIRAMCSAAEWKELWQEYFDISTDYAAIGRLILTSEDEYLKECYHSGSGVRILRQELWEMVVTFMISQNNNIKRIAGSVEKICGLYGKPLSGYKDIYTFPSPFDVPAEAFDNTELGLGYRDEYLRELFELVRKSPEFLEELSGMDTGQAMERLLAVKGIGKKVASCICLFGLHRVEAFPIDTHVKQILKEHYPLGFDFERYEGVAGIVQQYMFYNKLNKR